VQDRAGVLDPEVFNQTGRGASGADGNQLFLYASTDFFIFISALVIGGIVLILFS